LDNHIEQALQGEVIDDILVDLTETEAIDSTSLGLIAKLSIKAKRAGFPDPAVVSTNPDITHILMSMGFDHIFVLLTELPTSCADLKRLPMMQESEEQMRERIISAHRVLMELNEVNREAFKDLVLTLEASR